MNNNLLSASAILFAKPSLKLLEDDKDLAKQKTRRKCHEVANAHGKYRDLVFVAVKGGHCMYKLCMSCV